MAEQVFSFWYWKSGGTVKKKHPVWKTLSIFNTYIFTPQNLVLINCNNCQFQLCKFFKEYASLGDHICFQLYEVLLSCIWNTFNVKNGTYNPEHSSDRVPSITFYTDIWHVWYIFYAGLWDRRCVCDTMYIILQN